MKKVLKEVLVMFAPEGAFSVTNWYVFWSLNKALDYKYAVPVLFLVFIV